MDFLVVVFFAVLFLAVVFFAAVLRFAGPLARFSASSSTARSWVSDSMVSERGTVMLVTPSVMYGPNRPSFDHDILFTVRVYTKLGERGLSGGTPALFRLRIKYRVPVQG